MTTISAEYIKEALKETFKSNLINNETDLIAYANDASIFELVPSLVAKPNDVEDIKTLVQFVAKHHSDDSTLSITPRAAGTGMAGGALTESIVLSVENLKSIKELSEERAIVEPGLYYRDFEKASLEINRIMPSYPASKDLCAVGGMVGTNASGEKTLTYGSTDRYVQNLKVVLSDGNEYSFGPISKDALAQKMKLTTFEGEIYRKIYALVEENYDAIKQAPPKVSKNSTGYALWKVWDRTTFDLTKLFVGSEGTLGITTEITFKLVEPKSKSKLLVIFVKDLTMLPDIVKKVLVNKPESFESFDDNTFKFALHFFPDIVKSLHAGIIKLGLSFIPEFWMAVTGGIPKLILLAEFTGVEQSEVDERATKTERDLSGLGLKMHLAQTKADEQKYWTIRHESFNLLRNHASGSRTVPVIDDIIVAPEHLPEFLPRLTKVMQEYKLLYTIAGHIGDGNLHIIPLMDLRKADQRAMVMELAQKVFDLVFEFGGSMSAEHNDGLARTPFLKQMYGEKIFHLFEETKNIFDPKNIFNPHKKVNGNNAAFIQNHIDRVY